MAAPVRVVHTVPYTCAVIPWTSVLQFQKTWVTDNGLKAGRAAVGKCCAAELQNVHSPVNRYDPKRGRDRCAAPACYICSKGPELFSHAVTVRLHSRATTNAATNKSASTTQDAAQQHAEGAYMQANSRKVTGEKTPLLQDCHWPCQVSTYVCWGELLIVNVP